MAVDLAAIRRKLAQLSGNRSDSTVQLWKPEQGTYKVRGLPWKSAPDGVPFLERRILYVGDNRGFLAPEQFGRPDPVADLRRKLFNSKVPGDRDIAKKLMPKTKAYMPIIVRGQEEKGVQVWSFSNFVHTRLLSFYTDEELGNIDILDPEAGFDLKVTLTPSGKKFNGRTFLDTQIDPARNASRLSDNPKQAEEWLNAVPNIDTMWQDKSEAEIRKMLDAWINSGSAADTSTDGTSRGEEPVDEVAKLAEEIKADVKASQPSSTAAKPKDEKPKKAEKAKKGADIDDDDAPSAGVSSFDAAFQELMEKE